MGARFNASKNLAPGFGKLLSSSGSSIAACGCSRVTAVTITRTAVAGTRLGGAANGCQVLHNIGRDSASDNGFQRLLVGSRRLLSVVAEEFQEVWHGARKEWSHTKVDLQDDVVAMRSVTPVLSKKKAKRMADCGCW